MKSEVFHTRIETRVVAAHMRLGLPLCGGCSPRTLGRQRLWMRIKSGKRQ